MYSSYHNGFCIFLKCDCCKISLSDLLEENCFICCLIFLPKAERVHELNEEIGKLLAKVEQLGADGNVEESQKVMDEVEKARAKKREAEVI